MVYNIIVIRKELRSTEYRTPIVPIDIKILVLNNFKVFIEESSHRCFNTQEFIENGAILIKHEEIYNLDKNNTLILGLKELDLHDVKLFEFTHIYFSHTYKNQLDSAKILNMFAVNNGKIYDLEYLLDNQNNRLVHFCYHAGFVGALLGVLQYTKKINNNILKNLAPFTNIYSTINNLKKSIVTADLTNIKIALIGPNGKCGKGASNLLNILGLSFDGFLRNDNKSKLSDYNILINCIYLKKSDEIDPFISHNIIDKFNNCVIVDISCDFTNENNPIRIYNKLTTHANPVLKINEFVDLIAIDNLPTLAPIESSKDFSNKLVYLLIGINDEKKSIWDNCLSKFYEHLN